MEWTEKHNKITIKIVSIVSIVLCVILFFVGYYIKNDIIVNDLGYIYNTSDSPYFRGENTQFNDKFAKYTQYCFADKILNQHGVYELVFNDLPVSKSKPQDFVKAGKSRFYYFYVFSACGDVNGMPMLATNKLLVDLDTGQLFDIEYY